MVEDNAGNLIVGTGSTGNFNPNPITFGKGFFLYNGVAWTRMLGAPMLSGYSALPAVKSLLLHKSGTVIAATYGGGVLQYTNSAWSVCGNGLGNLNISSLAVKNDGTIVAGMDNGVSFLKGTTWVNEATACRINRCARLRSIRAVSLLQDSASINGWMAACR